MGHTKNLLIIGAGGHAASCIDIIHATNLYNIIGLVDNNLSSKISNYPQYQVIGNDENLSSLKAYASNAFIAIGQISNPDSRIRLYFKLKELGFSLPTIISPLAYVSPSASIGEGSIVMHHALINANARIGNVCIINSKALVEHDCVVGNFCHISTSATLNGTCKIGDNSFIGSNMILRQNTIIADNSVLYANYLESTPAYKEAREVVKDSACRVGLPHCHVKQSETSTPTICHVEPQGETSILKNLESSNLDTSHSLSMTEKSPIAKDSLNHTKNAPSVRGGGAVISLKQGYFHTTSFLFSTNFKNLCEGAKCA